MKLALSFLLLIITLKAFTSDKVDSLQAILDGNCHDSIRVKTKQALANELYETDQVSAFLLVNDAANLAVEKKMYKLAAGSYNQMGLFHYYSGQLNESKLCFAKSKGYFDLAGENLGSANAINNMGVIAYEQGYYSEALINYTKALKVRKFFRDSASIAVSYNNIGNVHKDLGELDEALTYYRRSIAMKHELNDDYGIAMTMNYMGLVYSDLGDLDSAKYCYKESLQLKKKTNDQYGLGMTYANLGVVHTNLEDFEIANAYLDSSLTIRNQMKDEYGILQSSIYLAQLRIKEEKYEEGIAIGEKQLLLALELGARVQEKDVYFLLYEAYSALGNFEFALEYYMNYDVLRDSLVFDERIIEAKQQENAIKVYEKEEEIQKLERKVNAPISIWKRGGTELAIFFGVLILVLIFLGKRGAKTDGNQGNIRDLFLTRILLVATASVYPIVGVLRAQSPDSIYDPINERFLISLLIIIPFLGTYFSKFIRRNAFFLVGLLFYVVSAHLIYLTYSNDFNLAYFIDFVVIQGAITVVFRRTKSTIFYLATVLIGIIIMYEISPTPQVEGLVIYTSLSMVLLVGVLVQITNININNQLKFTNQVVNSVDALVLVSDANAQYVYASNSIQRLLGFTQEEVLEKDFFAIAGLSKKEQLALRSYLMDLAVGKIGPSNKNIVEHKTKSGESRWIYWKDRRIENDLVLSVGQDITALQKLQAEVELNESNFRQINETVKDVFYLYNIEEGEYAYISPSCLEVMGADQDFFYSGKKHTATFVHPEDREKVYNAEKQINSGIEYDIEFRVIIDNKTLWLRERSYPIFNKAGEVIRNSGILQDVTEKKLIEEQIKVQSLVSAMTTNFVIIAGADDGIHWVNSAFKELFDFDVDDAQGLKPSELLKIDPVVVAEINKRVWENKLSFKGEVVYHKRNGEPVWAEVDIIPMFDENGEMERYFVHGTDLTERHYFERTLVEKERALARSEENFRELLRSVQEVFWLNDIVERKIVYVSRGYEKMFGAPREHLIENPTSWSDPIHPDDKDRVVKNFAAKVHYGGFNEEYRINHPKKGERWIHSRAFPIVDEDGIVVKISGVSTDITEKKNRDIKLKTFSEQLEIIHSIENAILTSETTEEIIYNTLQTAIDTLPIFRASLTLFDYDDESFDTYALREDKQKSATDGRKFGIEDFSMLETLQKTKTHTFQDIRKKENQTPSDKILIKEGASLTLMSPLFHGENLIGSLNVYFSDPDEEKNKQYIKITNEVAKGMAFAIYQSQLKDELAISTAETTEIADRLEIIHSIENTILTSESTESIIYNTLQQAIDKMPIMRASLALFDFEEDTFDSFAVKADGTVSDTNRRTYRLKEFGSLPKLREVKSHYFQDVRERKEKTETDRVLIEEGLVYILMSPLYHGDELIGSLNIGFGGDENQDNDQIILITNEVAKGLAFAIYQSRLKERIHYYNKEVTASIDYAQMIQDSYLPNDLKIKGSISDQFLFYKPKDIVSGDFYWTGKFEEHHIVAIGDCTGHGVPGAFMTIIGLNALDNIVKGRGITNPERILKELDKTVIKALKSDADYELKDGMDVGICSYNTKTGKLVFGGARRPLVIATKEEILEVQGTWKSIGESADEYDFDFTEVTIEHNPTNTYYIYSDGITDQFGGERRKKFSKRRLFSILDEIKTHDLRAQKERLVNEFEAWQGNHEQIDDVVFGAFKFDSDN
ncbi:MAG: PAS domain-containing protein [Crocinitomicaceae bacterium]|nr:PAS domain-containing protein [Crocinitomicaceae bacterium]